MKILKFFLPPLSFLLIVLSFQKSKSIDSSRSIAEMNVEALTQSENNDPELVLRVATCYLGEKSDDTYWEIRTVCSEGTSSTLTKSCKGLSEARLIFPKAFRCADPFKR